MCMFPDKIRQRYNDESFFIQKKTIYLIYTNHIFILTFLAFTVLNIFTTDFFIASILGFCTFLYLANYFLIYHKKYELAGNITLLLPMVVVGLDIFLAKNDAIIGFHISYRATVSFFTMMLIMSLIAVKRYQPIMVAGLSLGIIIAFFFLRFSEQPNRMDYAVLINTMIHYVIAGGASFLTLYLTEDLIRIAEEKTKEVCNTNIQLRESLSQIEESNREILKTREKESIILNSFPDLIFILNISGVVKECHISNDELVAYFGENCKGNSIFPLLTPKDADLLKKSLEAAYIDRQIQTIQCILVRDTDEKQLECRINFLQDYTFIMIVRDMTSQMDSLRRLKDAEDKMILTSRLSTLGEISAGIAHEINQPLNYLKGVLHILENEKTDISTFRSRIDKYLKNSQHSVNRIENIVNHLSNFVHNRELEKEPINIMTAIENSLIFFHEKIKLRKVMLNIHRRGMNFIILANPTRLEQVFVNLLQNAMDALSEVEEKQEKIIHIDIEKSVVSSIPFRYSVIITVHNSGKTMDHSIRDKIFDPFFSTREQGNGMGLGLSIVASIVKEHNGTIHLVDKNDGTAFRMEFPGYADEQ